MRARTALITLICAVGLVMSGCSSGIAGVPELAGQAGSGTHSQPGSGSSAPTGANPTNGLPTGGLPTGSTSDRSSGGGGATGLPSASGEDPGSSSTGSGGTLPTGPGSIPGVSSECMAVLNLSMTVGLLFMGVVMGGSQALTKAQVDQAFAQMGDVPPELKQPTAVLHDAAMQAVGKAPAQAAQILGSDQVNKAMDTVSKYADAKCGGS